MNDTIAAVATAPGRAGVAVVRVSGPDAFALAERLCGRRPVPGRFFFVRFRDPSRDDGAAIDEGLVLGFEGPHSYTGEDVVELQCHGGSVTPRRILEACFAAGARLARRGEFTERAFLNGRLDYDQAESVLDLIEAKTDRAADAALAGLGGRKRRVYRELYDRALALSADLEHALDIDEGELPEDFQSGMEARRARLRSDLEAAIRALREGRLLRDGALVVLAGPPNSGKSSLLNALVGESRAIVSATPGTTRDSIEEWMDFGGWPVRLVDTAGLRGTTDAIEAEGVRRTEDLVAKADVVLWLFDDADGAATARKNAGERTIAVGTKRDLSASVADGADVRISSKTGEGLEALRRAIVAKLERLAERMPAGVGPRCGDALFAALSALTDVPAADDPVLLANAVRSAGEHLGTLVGATYSADLLDSLFSRFCVGK